MKQKNRPKPAYLMRREGLEPSRPKAVTGSLVLRVCQFRHPRDWVPYYYNRIETPCQEFF